MRFLLLGCQGGYVPFFGEEVAQNLIARKMHLHLFFVKNLNPIGVSFFGSSVNFLRIIFRYLLVFLS